MNSIHATNLSDYILRSKEDRTSHIDLSEPCCLLGKRGPRKDEILQFLGIRDDLDNWRSAGVRRCHSCNHDSKNGWCRNPRHYYLGTPTENSYASDGSVFNKGFAAFKNPETGEYVRMEVEKAKALGWEHSAKGQFTGMTVFKDPETGESARMSSEQASSLGWVGVASGTWKVRGTTPFRNPETGECRHMTKEEATSLGWVSPVKGTVVVKDQVTGKRCRIPREEASRREETKPGWLSR